MIVDSALFKAIVTVGIIFLNGTARLYSMKKLILLILLACLRTGIAEARDHNPISILSTNGIVYLKFQKFMMGATLEIRDESGALIVNEKVVSKKIIIDFFYHKTGRYQIKIKKNDIEQLFSYESIDFVNQNSVPSEEYAVLITPQ